MYIDQLNEGQILPSIHIRTIQNSLFTKYCGGKRNIIWTPLNYTLWQQQSLELVLVSANNNLYKNFAGFNMTKIFSYMRNANLFVHIFFFEFAFFLRRRTVINRNTNQQYRDSSAQCARMDLNKRFLPKPMTTTG